MACFGAVSQLDLCFFLENVMILKKKRVSVLMEFDKITFFFMGFDNKIKVKFIRNLSFNNFKGY